MDPRRRTASRTLRLLRSGYRFAVRGIPAVLVVRGHVHKVARGRAGVRQLAREARWAAEAAAWPAYAPVTITPRLITPFVLVSPYHPRDPTSPHALATITAFMLGRLSEARDAVTVPAAQLFRAYAQHLGIRPDRVRDLWQRFDRCVAAGSFDFPVPSTAMHGDFNLNNVFLSGGQLRVIDFEYATPAGSVVYDAWYLRRSLALAGVAGYEVRRYDEGVCSALAGFGLTGDRFHAFGHAMHALADFSRLPTRGARGLVLEESLEGVERFVRGERSAAWTDPRPLADGPQREATAARPPGGTTGRV